MSNLIPLQTFADRRARQILAEEQRRDAFEVQVTDEDRFRILGVDRDISRREAQQLFRELGALLGVDCG